MVLAHQILCWGAFFGVSAAVPTRVHKRESIPDYAITYAPWTYLYSSEAYFPSDIATHLENTIPEVDFVALGAAGSVTVDTLNSYNSSVYLTSKDDTSDPPVWLQSTYGTPDSSGYSASPATIIAVQKNSTWVDVFYFYFYSYNEGGKVLGINFDDHVGDWEHSMIRFINGEPYAIYLSEHSAGSAYYWDVMDFNGDRPLTYVANGGHANYTIALGLISDKTDKGIPWDVTQNYRGYWYDTDSGEFTAASGASTGATEEADETTTWLQWEGQWGDEQYATGTNGHQRAVLHF